MGESRYSLEEAFPATAHARALAEAAGDRTLTLEEEVVEINRQIEKLGEADEAEAVQMLDAELLAEEEAARAEEAARSESPKAEEAARNEGEGSPRAEVPAEAKPDAGGGEAAAGRELAALRVRAAEPDERLRAKGLRKAERAKISEELSGVQARMHELSGGNLVLFSKGEAAAARPALSPTKAALRDRLLLKIARTAGIRVIREGSEQITASSRNAELRMRLGGYMGSAWSARANDALERGLRPAPMVAKELGVSAEAVELHMRSPEWHHVGDDYEEVHFYDPDEAPLTDADAVEDAETARSFLRYVEMLNYDTRTFTVKPRVAGRFESEASDEAYALFTSRGTAVAKEAFEAEDEFRALVEKETASAEELRAAAKATLAAAKSGRKKMEAAAKAFLAKHKDWARARPRRARRGTNGLRYSREEAFPATAEEREGIERGAKANGTWLKAPNGKPSELTPEQWVTVRTRAFKEWFGDWENDAKNASKVVDGNGEPLVVYHGSPSEFNEFSLRYLGTNGTAEGYGFYFTDRRAVAESYARGTEAQRHQGANGRLFEVFLNIAKPLSNERVTMTREEFRRFLRELSRQTDADGNPLELLSNYGDAAYEGENAVMKEAERLEYDGNDNDVDIVHSIINAVGDKERVFRVLRSTTGFDGIVADNPKWGGDQTVYVAFSPTQIKSATENVGTFDAGNPDIRYSISMAEQAAWDGVLDDYEAGRLRARGMVTVLPRTPAVLQRCGAANLPLKISKGVLDKVTKEKHGVPVRELRGLLVNLDNPIAVFRSRTQADSLVVLTELRDEANGNNAVVAVRLDAKSDSEHEINAIASVYGKSPYSIDGMLRDGLALYLHTKKNPRLSAIK